MHDRFDWSDWTDETPLPDYDARGDFAAVVGACVALVFIVIVGAAVFASCLEGSLP